jgi:prophage tail gpP-like protein
MIKVTYDNIDITSMVKSVDWSGHIEKPNRELSLSLINTTNGKTQALSFTNGKSIEFYNEDVKLFRGIIFANEIDSQGNLSITAYDENIYLVKNNETRKFKNMKASDIIIRLCKDFGIAFETITDTEYVIPKLIIDNKSLIDIIRIALTITQKQIGKHFILGNSNGKLTLTKYADSTSKWIIESGTNLTNARYSQSIEDMKTQVKVTGGTEKSPIEVTVKNSSLSKQFGVMQYVEGMDEKAKRSQLEQRANALLKEFGVINDQASIEAVGIDEVIAGTSVYVREPMTKILGGFYVSSDSHHYENGAHTMSLEISATYDLPPIEIEAEVLGK